IEAARKPLEKTPLLEEVIPGGRSSPDSTRGEPATPPPVRVREPIRASTPGPTEPLLAEYPGPRRRGDSAPLLDRVGGVCGRCGAGGPRRRDRAGRESRRGRFQGRRFQEGTGGRPQGRFGRSKTNGTAAEQVQEQPGHELRHGPPRHLL